MLWRDKGRPKLLAAAWRLQTKQKYNHNIGNRGNRGTQKHKRGGGGERNSHKNTQDRQRKKAGFLMPMMGRLMFVKNSERRNLEGKLAFKGINEWPKKTSNTRRKRREKQMTKLSFPKSTGKRPSLFCSFSCLKVGGHSIIIQNK